MDRLQQSLHPTVDAYFLLASSIIPHPTKVTFGCASSLLTLCVRKSAYSLSSTHPHPHPGLLVGRECNGGAVGPDMKTTPFFVSALSSAEVGLREDSGTQSI
jgi:hypothetical protein